jgi:endoglucanase
MSATTSHRFARLLFASALAMASVQAIATEVRYSVVNHWNDGLNADVTVINSGGGINSWRLEFDYPYAISNIWNANIASKSGGHYTINGPSWNASLPAGGRVSFGFTAQYAGAAAGATLKNCRLNGQAVTTGVCGGGTLPPDGNKLPVANANGPYSGTTGQAVNFSSVGSTDPDGRITGYAWDFGDGSKSSLASPKHSYAVANNYTAKLTVTDDKGADASATAAVAIALTAGVGTTPLSKNGQLKVCGNHLCNASGKQIQLRGMSGHGPQWFPKCYSDAALDALANSWGADIFRVAMYVQEGGYVTDPAGYRAFVDDQIAKVSSRGMYVLVDWHILTPGDPNANLAAAKEFFDYMSKKHAGNNAVIYEIANEPNGNDVDWARIKSYAEQVIPVIRNNAPNAVIIVGTPDYSSLGLSSSNHTPQQIIDSPLTDGNVMYTFHFYAASHTDYHRNGMAAFAQKLPVFVTEFGTQSYTGDGPNDLGSSQKWIDMMAANKISWINWNFSDDSRSGAVLGNNACTNGGPFTGSSLKEAGTWIQQRMLSPADDF